MCGCTDQGYEGKGVKTHKATEGQLIDGLEIGPMQLIEHQRADESLKRYWKIVGKPSVEGKPQFVVKKRILYRKLKTKCGVEYKMQLVVPAGLSEKVVALAHDTLLSGHRGAAKTLRRVQQEFYWPGIHNFVTRYVASCDLCQRSVSKGTIGKAPMGKLPLAGTPFSTVCVDIIGPLSPPSDGYIYILTLIDMCTRFPEAVALKDITTIMVAEALLEIFSRVGLPLKVHSDRRSQFTSDMMQKVYTLISVKQSTTSPYHAMGNGIVENFNKSLKNLLKKIASEKPKDWHCYLGPLMFAVRDTPQDSTGFTPFEVIYGRSVHRPMSLLRKL